MRRVAGDPLEPDSVRVAEEAGIAWMKASSRGWTPIFGGIWTSTGALRPEGALEDLDHLGAREADRLHVRAAEVADGSAAIGAACARGGAPVGTPRSPLSSSVWPLTRSATSRSPPPGRVWLLADNPREPELVFDFPFHEDLNEAVKELPRRWFDWRRKHWRVPAHPRVAKAVEALLAQFPDLVPTPEVLAWLSDSDRWRAVVHGRGA